ncbi:hypothetical protein [Streptomyces sp. CBMA29]|uniref:hypothetical protein n=1 Tax=Streptomyces sp. CBMA29 TaxID=1896314 RepID=UPI00166215BA|nr:hypothetical protein [Streptomyces sp. CBMA29]MBD0734916.1 hypothetical protein [Streptomyces sp. CBMA29]
MNQLHHFHIEHAGHSISVDVSGGHHREVELLVDGREVGHREDRNADRLTLSGELPEDPPRPFAVRVAGRVAGREEGREEGWPHHRSQPPTCTLVLAGEEFSVPDRTPVRRPDHRVR